MAAQIALQNGSVRMTATLTDISLGGCYVEMLSPLPVDTFVDIAISPDDKTLQLSGRVRSSQTNFGMGVSFTGMRPQDFEVLRKTCPSYIERDRSFRSRRPRLAARAGEGSRVLCGATEFDSADLPTTPGSARRGRPRA